ncbi:MAG: hypothetical protein AABY22_08415, partial [Nanoarchaeota archaeon]
MKQYKHIPTGKIFQEQPNGFYENYSDYNYKNVIQRTVVPEWMVNLGKDWEEIKQLVLTTQDGVEKFAGDDVWYVRPDNTIYHWKKIYVFDNMKGYRFFTNE